MPATMQKQPSEVALARQLEPQSANRSEATLGPLLAAQWAVR
jgi:hypothetical protein